MRAKALKDTPPHQPDSIVPRSHNCRQKVGGRDRDRTGDPLLAKQVLSQLSYTPTVGVTFILEHFRGIQNPFLRFCVITVPKPLGKGLFAPQAMDFFVRVVNETYLLLLDESVAPT